MELMVHALAKVTEEAVGYYGRSLMDEDEAVISGGVRMDIKRELQELEDRINYASFILAGGDSDPEQKIDDWISEARRTAFCLADQIAMYAIRGSANYRLVPMKRDIGKLRIRELRTRMKDHRTVGEELVQGITQQLPELSPFIRRIPSVPTNAIVPMEDKIAKVEAFFAGPHPVLFITGGQGLGKTTLTKHVYDSQKQRMNSVPETVGASLYGRMFGFLSLLLSELSLPFFFRKSKDAFDQCCWVDTEETGGLVSLLKMVLKGSNVDCDSIDEFEIISTVRATFKDKYCLVVLDNVQDISVLYSLTAILQNLKYKIICLTRRDIQEDKNQDVLRIPGLEPCDSLKFFLSAAFREFNSTPLSKERFSSTVRDGVLRDAIAQKYEVTSQALPPNDQLVKMVKLVDDILCKCQDNPWNIWSIGTLLEKNPLGKWEEIGKRVDGMLIDGTKTYENRDPSVELEDAKLGDATIRHCLLYCLAFPQTSEILENSGGIPTRKLIRMWTAEGYVQDSQSRSQEQEADRVLEELINRKLLLVKKKSLDGEVLKCSVNEHLRPLAEKMCEQQKFCKVVAGDTSEASSPSTSRMTNRFPLSPNIRLFPGRGKKTLSDRYRMLAVHGDRAVKQVSKTLGKDIRLRSLLYFRTGTTEHSKLKLSFRGAYMLLRTLELQGARLDKLTPNIDCLVCLRYLGLRNTQLEALPPTLQRLTHLMCLDIRDNNIAELADVSQFEEMRHLYLTNSFRSHSVAVREGLHSLVNLQTLSGAAYGESSAGMSLKEQISYLRHLRKLSMKKAPSASAKDICDVINGIEPLESLAIACDRDGQEFDISALKIGKNLRKLKLGGPMGNFCLLGEKMKSITFLYLWDSKLPIQLDILYTLRGLTNLLVLSLANASTREEMSCGDGYKKLKKLSVISMENLTECEFGEEAMGNLEELVFAKCGNLKTPPQRIDQLGSLREVHLTGMLSEFCNEAKAKLNGKVYVLPDELSHVVPSRAAAGAGR